MMNRITFITATIVAALTACTGTESTTTGGPAASTATSSASTGSGGRGGSGGDSGSAQSTSATGGAASGVGGAGDGGGTGGSAGSGGGSSSAGGNAGAAGGGGTAGGTTGTGGSAGSSGGTSGSDAGVSTPKANFYVEGRMLKDPCGQDFVMRGYNHMMVYADRPCAACAEMAKAGANVVRMMWETAVALSEAESAVNAALKSGMVPMLEMQDATCQWGQPITDIVTFWQKPETVAFVKKHQQHLLVNIANEPGTADDATYSKFFTDAIAKLRTAGIHTPLIVDGSGCGRNAEQLLRVGPAILQADPDKNMLFAWHVYDSGADQVQRVTNVLAQSVSAKLPFFVGEFSVVGAPFCDGVPYQTVIAEAQKQSIGYLPWSFTKGNSDCKMDGGPSPMDMTTNNTFATLRSGWATEVSLSNANSIQKTSVRSKFIETGACR